MKRYIAEGLSEYLNDFHSVWHMPGHKRKSLSDSCGLDNAGVFSDRLDFNLGEGRDDNYDLNKLDLTLDMLHGMDVTEVPGLDDLHNPNGMIKESENELARVYKTFASYYLVNGSTCGIFAAISACVSPEDKIIVASNCHKSVHNIIDLLRLDAVFVKPQDIKLGNTYRIFGDITADTIESVCSDNPDAKAVVITSPTYEGVISDINKISKIVHEKGMKLIVDEAHGAQLPFICHKDDSLSAIYNGADIIVQSLHKTLPSMTQTAILHVMDESLNSDIKKYLSVFMSSSPSYIMLADMERAVDIAQNKNYDNYLTTLIAIRNKIKGLKNLSLLDNDGLFGNCFFGLDPTRIVLYANESITGAGMYKLLSDEFGIVCEMSGLNYVVLISTFFDTDEDFDYLYQSLKKIDDNYDSYINKIRDIEKVSNQVYTFNANFKDKAYIEKTVDILKELEGTAAKDNIYVYPPGIYIVKKGEIYTKESIDVLISHVRQGRQLYGELI